MALERPNKEAHPLALEQTELWLTRHAHLGISGPISRTRIHRSPGLQFFVERRTRKGGFILQSTGKVEL